MTLFRFKQLLIQLTFVYLCLLAVSASAVVKISDSFITHAGFHVVDLQADHGGFNYKGTMYFVDKNAPVMVAFHGFTANTLTWEAMGKYLNKLGYNFVMINHLGHGNGDHRSETLGNRGFKGMWARWRRGLGHLMQGQLPHASGGKHNAHYSLAAVENAIELVSEIFQSRVTVLGHSFGGMTTSTAISGVDVNPEGTGISDPASGEARAKAEKISQETVSGHMAIGMPGDFVDHPKALRGLGKYLEALFRAVLFPMGLTEVTIPFVGSLQPYRERDTSMDRIQRKWVERGVSWALENGILPDFFEEWDMVMKIYNTPELYAQWVRFLSNGTSGLNLDLVADFITFSREYKWTEAYNPYVPTVMVMGEKDKLAYPEGTARHIAARREHAEVPVIAITVQDVGHLAIVVGDVVAKMLAPFAVLADRGGRDPQWYKDFVQKEFDSHDIRLNLKDQTFAFLNPDGSVKSSMTVETLYDRMAIEIPNFPRKTRMTPPARFRKLNGSGDCQSNLDPAA